ncbi:MAG: hypothetical protein AVDCRST_MAG74-1261, partial [uncultured Pyrinomonadaceae bacterium]
ESERDQYIYRSRRCDARRRSEHESFEAHDARRRLFCDDGSQSFAILGRNRRRLCCKPESFGQNQWTL